VRFLIYILIGVAIPVICFGREAHLKAVKNDTIFASYKGGNYAYAEYIKVNYIDFNKPEKGKRYKIYAEIYLPERSLSCPEARISTIISKDLTDDNKVSLCNALASRCDTWIYKTYNGKRIQASLYYEIIISAETVKVKSIKYSSKLGWFRHYEEQVYDTK